MTPFVQHLKAYIRLTRLDRPIGILLLLWPMLWALWLAASGWPDTKVLIIFVVGTTAAWQEFRKVFGCSPAFAIRRYFEMTAKPTAASHGVELLQRQRPHAFSTVSDVITLCHTNPLQELRP